MFSVNRVSVDWLERVAAGSEPGVKMYSATVAVDSGLGEKMYSGAVAAADGDATSDSGC